MLGVKYIGKLGQRRVEGRQCVPGQKFLPDKWPADFIAYLITQPDFEEIKPKAKAARVKDK